MVDDDFSAAPQTFQLHLEGFDGPLYLLLDLARRQQVNLAQISISMLISTEICPGGDADKNLDLVKL